MSLIQRKIFKYIQCTIQTKLHNEFTLERTKIGLNPFDDKRHVMSDHTTLPYGHYLLEKLNP